MIVDPYDISCNMFRVDKGRICLFSNTVRDPNLWMMFPIYGCDRGKPFITKEGKRIYLDIYQIRCLADIQHMFNCSLNIIDSIFMKG